MRNYVLIFVFLLLCCLIAEADETIRVVVTRDNWVSSVGEEENGNNGASTRLKVKGNQEMTLLDFETSSLEGRVIKRAVLHVKLVDPKIPLLRVGISTLGTDWTEGTGNGYEKIEGASTFRWKAYPNIPWGSEAGYSDLTSVMFGEGGTVWCQSDATPPDAEGWQTIVIDPKIIAARVAGTSFGLVVFDDTGTELVRSGENNEQVTINLFPNRFFYSRDQNKSVAPYLTVQLADQTVTDSSSKTSKTIPPLPKLGNATVAILDELDKVTETGTLIPNQPESYFAVNHLWDASQRQIHLFAARNEFIGFQIHLTGDLSGVKPSLVWKEQSDNISVQFSRFGYVASKIGKIADPVIPLGETLNVRGRDTILCELFVPETMTPGEHHGTLRLASKSQSPSQSSSESLELNILLTVWDFALPNTLSFLPEMNCYSLPENERDYYRLAQLHRTFINRVPYSHRGTVSEGCAPTWNETSQTFDWSSWDARYKDYFNGSVFADLPRGAVPVEAFYLPLFENFPADIFAHYNGNHWAREAFSEEYCTTFQAAAREFARHLVEQHWNKTCFEFFLNNKMDYKRNGWSRASSPWLLDEPASYQDFAALEFFGELFQNGVRQAFGLKDVPIRFRCDISRPQWQRDSLDKVLGVNVVGGEAFHKYNRMVNSRKERFGQILYTYGTTCSPEDGAYQPVAWSLDAWTLGANGIVPWQTIGDSKSWEKSDELALFYPMPQTAESRSVKVVPSLRLKGYRRGQQDVEYLVQLQKKLQDRMQLSRQDIAQMVRQELNFQSQNQVTTSEDAGTLNFNAITPQELFKLRKKVAGEVASVPP